MMLIERVVVVRGGARLLAGLRLLGSATWLLKTGGCVHLCMVDKSRILLSSPVLARVISITFGLTRIVLADRVVSLNQTASMFTRRLLFSSGISREPALAEGVGRIASDHARPSAMLVEIALFLTVC